VWYFIHEEKTNNNFEPLRTCTSGQLGMLLGEVCGGGAGSGQAPSKEQFSVGKASSDNLLHLSLPAFLRERRKILFASTHNPGVRRFPLNFRFCFLKTGVYNSRYNCLCSLKRGVNKMCAALTHNTRHVHCASFVRMLTERPILPEHLRGNFHFMRPQSFLILPNRLNMTRNLKNLYRKSNAIS
jgi:hypothetical protein